MALPGKRQKKMKGKNRKVNAKGKKRWGSVTEKTTKQETEWCRQITSVMVLAKLCLRKLH